MYRINKCSRTLVAMLLFVSPWIICSAEEVAAEIGKPELIGDEIDPKDWGIRNGCIRSSQIESINYVAPHMAKVALKRNKTAIMTFRNSCNDLKFSGVKYETRTGELCARFDYLTVLDSGTICRIISIEPFLPLDDPEQLEE